MLGVPLTPTLTINKSLKIEKFHGKDSSEFSAFKVWDRCYKTCYHGRLTVEPVEALLFREESLACQITSHSTISWVIFKIKLKSLPFKTTYLFVE